MSTYVYSPPPLPPSGPGSPSRIGLDRPTPKLKVPFQVVNGRAVVVEQDSLEEIGQCVFAVCATRLGQRDELPEFGISDLTFSRGTDLDEINEAIEEWEPRADALTETELAEAIERVKASVSQ